MESETVNYNDFMSKINQCTNASRLIYRGIGNASYPLLPTVWRKEVQESGHFESFKTKIEICDNDNKREMMEAGYWEWVIRVCFENYLLATFWYRSNLCGLPVECADNPENYISRWVMHQKPQSDSYHYLGRYKDACKWFDKSHQYRPFKAVWESLEKNPEALERVIFYNSTIPRHHGLPTRLLDWSHSPYVALFFAAYDSLLLDEKESMQDEYVQQENEKHTHFSIYALDIEKEGAVSLVREDNIAHNKFLFHQNGLFTIYNRADRYYIEENTWPDLCQIEQKDFKLYKYNFKREDAESIIQEIKKYGVSYSRLKPSFSDVAHEINQIKEVLIDDCSDYS